MAKTKTQGKTLLHHPGIRKEIRRGPKLAALLVERSGWAEGPLPAEAEPAPVTAGGQDEPAATPAKKTTTSKNEGK